MNGHGTVPFDGAFASGLAPMNYDAIMSLQNQASQSNQPPF